MNKNQIKGAAKEAVGKIQKKFGDMTDNEVQQEEGLQKQVEGNAQKTAGDVQETVRDTVKKP